MEFNATFIVSAVSFIIFTFIMNWIFYKPLERIVNQRNAFIDENFNEAKEATDKAQAIRDNKDLKLEKTSKDAKKILIDKTTDANSQKDSITSSAKQKTTDEISKAKESLASANTDAKTDLDNRVVELAQMISDKIMGEHIPMSVNSEANNG